MKEKIHTLLFDFKLSEVLKSKLDEMVRIDETTSAAFIRILIQKEWNRRQKK